MPVRLLARHDLHVGRLGRQSVEHRRRFVKERQAEGNERVEHAWHEDGQDDDHQREANRLSHSGSAQGSYTARPALRAALRHFLLRQTPHADGRGRLPQEDDACEGSCL